MADRGDSRRPKRTRNPADRSDDTEPSSQAHRTSDAAEPSTPTTPPRTPTSLGEAPIDDLMGDSDAGEEDPESGESLIGDGMEQDYRAIPELDTYEGEAVDDEGEYDLTAEARAAAEREMADRDRIERRERLPAALRTAAEEEFIPAARRRAAERAAGVEVTEEQYIQLEDFKGPLREWIVLEGPRNEIKRRFRMFLTAFVEEGQSTAMYAQRIHQMAADQRQTLEVSFVHLSQGLPLLAIWVADAPSGMLEIFSEVAREVVLTMYPVYAEIQNDIVVRIVDLPICDKLRDLRQVHLNALIKVGGVVTRRTGVFPQLKLVRFNCAKCGYVVGPFVQSSFAEIKVGSCPDCQSKGPFSVNEEQTVYNNYQKITLQESPGTVPPGRLPRSKEVILLGDLIDCARPGEEIEVIGIYTNNYDTALNRKHGFPVFATVIEANSVSKKDNSAAASYLTDEDRRDILKLSKEASIGEKIIASIAPSIYGNTHVKMAVALALFGGEAKDAQGRHRIRGDINVLLIGDPGTAKSQVLKYIEKTAHRAVFTTGQGASAVGLTAAVQRDPVTREFTLEGGALVLADRGVCMIDEFDKMNDQDRTSIHEAMEQQSISISKAGIVTTLQARCAVFAAANPVRGRYDPALTLSDNVDLSEPLLSRFDVICILRDTVEPLRDEHLARFVVNSHMRSHPNHQAAETDAERAAAVGQTADKILSQEVLRKYIMYAKQHCHPKLTGFDQDKITALYSELRRQIHAVAGGVQVSVRHIESLIRMSEAHARMHLRDFVNDDDVDVAIRVLLESFIDQQKQAVKRTLEKNFAKFITYKKDQFELLLHLLETLVKEQMTFLQNRQALVNPGQPFHPKGIDVAVDEFEARARELGMLQVDPFYRSRQFTDNHFVIDARRRTISKSFQTAAAAAPAAAAVSAS